LGKDFKVNLGLCARNGNVIGVQKLNRDYVAPFFQSRERVFGHHCTERVLVIEPKLKGRRFILRCGLHLRVLTINNVGGELFTLLRREEPYCATRTGAGLLRQRLPVKQGDTAQAQEDKQNRMPSSLYF